MPSRLNRIGRHQVGNERQSTFLCVLGVGKSSSAAWLSRWRCGPAVLVWRRPYEPHRWLRLHVGTQSVAAVIARASAMQVGALTLPMYRLIFTRRAASKGCKCWPMYRSKPILFDAILNDIYMFLFSFIDKRSRLDRRSLPIRVSACDCTVHSKRFLGETPSHSKWSYLLSKASADSRSDGSSISF